MPNWSYNTLSIFGDNKEIVNFYKENSNITEEKKERHLDFYKSVPIPKEKEKDWYNWNCQNLGTKWNIHESDFKKETNVGKGTLSILRKILTMNSNSDIECFMKIMKDYHTTDTYIYNFDTAWSPPFNWLFTVSEKYPTITFKIRYDTEGYDDSGILVVYNGDVIYEDRFSTSERFFENNKESITKLIKKFMEDEDNKELLNDKEELMIAISEELCDEYSCYFDVKQIRNLFNEMINKN